MAQRGGISHINYKETRGLKTGSGTFVTKGTILTRQGSKWKAGINVGGTETRFALCDGTVYFTKKKGSYRTKKSAAVINIQEAKPAKKQ